MKTIKIIIIALLVFACKNETKSLLSKNSNESNETIKSNNSDFIVIEQDYSKALKIASQEKKILFIDFYTTWCAPCKKLDKLVFENDSIKKLLGKNFVMLKYDAENDTVFHLSKKHHVSSYPTAIVLNNEGFILNRKYGFLGNNAEALQKSVVEFTDESISLNKENKMISGYSNTINPSKYPKFYVDYVNRTNIKINKSELNDYFINTQDRFSEEYFTTSVYFGYDLPLSLADWFLTNKQKYIDLYGELDVKKVLYSLSSTKFDKAVLEKSQEKFDDAIKFVTNALNKKFANSTIEYYKKEFFKSQNKWNEIYKINKKLKEDGKFDNGYINDFSWQVYEKCDDKDVINKCIIWMKEVTNQEPNYAYLDTYVHLLYKSGNKPETKRIARLAIQAAKKENRSTKALEKLLNTI